MSNIVSKMQNRGNRLMKNEAKEAFRNAKQPGGGIGGKSIDFSQRELPRTLLIDVKNNTLKFGKEGFQMGAIFTDYTVAEGYEGGIAFVEYLKAIDSTTIDKVILDNGDGFKIKSLDELITDITNYTKSINPDIINTPVIINLCNDVMIISDTTLDSVGNIICVGDSPEVDGDYGRGFIRKFDRELNQIANVLCEQGSHLTAVTTDTLGNIIVVGYISDTALVVKYDANLNEITQASVDIQDLVFNDVVTDSDNNIFCAGSVFNTDDVIDHKSGDDAFIIKYNSELHLHLSIQRTFKAGSFTALGIYPITSNIVAVGHTKFELYRDTASIKVFDRNLETLSQRTYEHDADSSFSSVLVDNDSIVCVGHRKIEHDHVTDYEGIIVRYSDDLSLLLQKSYESNSTSYFHDIKHDLLSNYVVVGNIVDTTKCDAIVTKYDRGFNIIGQKQYGSTGSDVFSSILVDSTGSIFCAGHMTSVASGSKGVITKFDKDLVSNNPTPIFR